MDSAVRVIQSVILTRFKHMPFFFDMHENVINSFVQDHFCAGLKPVLEHLTIYLYQRQAEPVDSLF